MSKFIAAILLCAVSAVAQNSIPARQVKPGPFQSGSYSFPGDVDVKGQLTCNGEPCAAAGQASTVTDNGANGDFTIAGKMKTKKGPVIDVTAWGATGSASYTTATCTSGSATVTLATAQDFQNSDGVHLFHCGTPVALAAPTGMARTIFGTPGAKQFTYWVSALTKNGGQGPASDPFVVSDAPNATFSNGTGLKITWDAVAGADGYAIYHKTASGSEVLKDIVGIPGQASTWVKNRPYHTGDAVRPVTDNGRWYKATGVKTRSLMENGGVAGCTAGASCTVTPLSMTGIINGGRLRIGGYLYTTNEVVTVSNVTSTTFDIAPTKRQPNGFTIEAISGTTEPTWCSTSRCTVTDGGITWTEQPFYFYEDGGDFGPASMLGYNGLPANRLEQSVPLTHPTSNLAETLVTSVASGGGTTSLTLAGAAGASTSGWLIEHDDTAAIIAAQNELLNNQISSKPAYEGSPYMVNSGCVSVPWGKGGRYKITSPLGISACMQGEGNPIIEQVHPLQNLMFAGYAYAHSLSRVSLYGGMNQFHYLNSNTGGAVWIDNVYFVGCRGFGIFNSQRPGGDNDLHLSSDFHVTNSGFFGCRHDVYNQTDYFTIAHATYFGHTNGQDPETGYIDNESGDLSIDDWFASPPVPAPNNRWIDTRTGQVHINNMRFGGESAGMPNVVTHAPYDFSRSGYGGINFSLNYQGQNITIENSAICALGSVIVAKDSLPGFVHVRGSGCKNNSTLIDTSNLNLDEVLYDTTSFTFDATRLPSYEVIKYDININQMQGNSMSVPAALAPALTHRVAMASAPTSGNWMQGQIVYKSGTIASGDPVGWIAIRSGRAATKWVKDTVYAQGSWVIPATDNGRVYYAIVGGTSGSSEPLPWAKASSTWASATTTDGTVTWADYGPAVLFEDWPPASSSESGSTGIQLTDIERNGIGNRLDWSDDFSQWNQTQGVTVTGTTTDPWGGSNAYVLSRPGSGGAENLRMAGVINATGLTANQVLSCWAKAGTLTQMSVGLWDGTASANAGFQTVNLTDAWQRFVMPMTLNTGHTFTGVSIYPGGTGTFAGTINLSSCQLWNEDTYHVATKGTAIIDANSGFALTKNARFAGGILASNIHGGSASTGSIAGSSSAVVTVTWSDGGFADANYFPSCSVKASELTGATLKGHHVTAQTATTVDYLVVNDDSSAHTGTVSCTGIK